MVQFKIAKKSLKTAVINFKIVQGHQYSYQQKAYASNGKQ